MLSLSHPRPGDSSVTVRELSDPHRNVSGVDAREGLMISGPQVIAYARISDLSGKRGRPAALLGLESQLAVCADLARRAGFTLVGAHTDNDRSASRNDPRPGFEALLLDLYRGRTAHGVRVEGVIAVDDDRLYKTPEQWERFVTAFRASPGRVYADDRGLRDLYASDADERGGRDVEISMGENGRRSDRTRRWHAARARRGIAHTGGRAFGYRPVDGRAGEIEIVPEEAAVIRAAVAACAEGLSWGAITDLFARSGLSTAKGGLWRTQTVKQIVGSPRLAGFRVLGGEVVTGEDGERVVGGWAPIITEAEWEAVRQRCPPRVRSARGGSPAPRTARKYLLSGFLLCGNEPEGRTCGCVMAGCSTKAGRSGYRYACRPRADGGCGGTAVRGEWIDREVADLVLAVLADAPAEALERPGWARRHEFDAMTARLDAVRASRERCEIGEEAYQSRSETLCGILRQLSVEKREWEALGACLQDTPAERAHRWSLEPADGGYDLAQRRALVSRTLVSALVFPVGKGVQHRGKGGYLPILAGGVVGSEGRGVTG